jgi:hypothetical protein
MNLRRVVAALAERCDRLEEKVEHVTAENAARITRTRRGSTNSSDQCALATEALRRIVQV